MRLSDPVDALLSRRDFGQQLHERALYVLRRSLKDEDASLYQLALRVYRTRNRIAHRGEVEEQQPSDFLSMDRAGAIQALRCAVDILRWLGLESNYFIPDRDPSFVHVALSF